MIKVIYFDMSGVIVTTSSYKKTFIKLLEKTYHNPTITFDDIYFIFEKLEIGKIHETKAVELLGKTISKDASMQQQILLFTRTAKALHIRPSIVKLIKSLRKKVKVGVLTNSIQPNADRHKRLGHYDYFDYQILSHEMKIRKPNKGIFLCALKKARVQPNEVLFVDDSQENITAAKKIGINTILFTSTRNLIKQLKRFNL
jgi:epoxide hydrolase-like predicted phosphatase